SRPSARPSDRAAGPGLAGSPRRPYSRQDVFEEPFPMINLSERARDKVREIQKAENLEGQGLRVRVIGGGCSGFTYDLFFDDEVNQDVDEVFDAHGIPVYIDM